MEHYRRWESYFAVFVLAVDANLVLTEYVLTWPQRTYERTLASMAR